MKRKLVIILALIIGFSFMISLQTFALTDSFRNSIYNPGPLKPLDSLLKVKVGDSAPGFSLPSVSGKMINLSDYRGKKIVVLSFVPAAWTPVCSDQWPGYNIVEELFKEQDAVLLGITVDNIPSLFSWIQQMGDLWFPVLSDFWPHGAVADSFGLLRTDGMAERALVVIDKNGIISYIGVGDINVRPPLEILIGELQKLNSK
ncbi:MAG: peroxiredoxin [Deltaproteobacteria bacterium]|nr:peroxiredoxin [Candidatus Tharpella aukensis]